MKTEIKKTFLNWLEFYNKNNYDYTQFKVGDTLVITKYFSWNSFLSKNNPKDLTYPLTTKLLKLKRLGLDIAGLVNVNGINYGIELSNDTVKNINKICS